MITITEASANATTDLLTHILDRSARVTVLGQGYVGLSLSCAAAGTGSSLVGIDVDDDRIEELSGGHLTVPGVNEEAFSTLVASGQLRFTTDPSVIGRPDVIAICVPTPPGIHDYPNLVRL
jgi:UDP-N-acetyl-D-glucosamine dehydrogenase